jgi:CPA2 family monovalent cation:H+ antiporter-2
MALMGERELAFGMMDYALRSFGLSEDRVRLIVQGFRTSGQASDRKTVPRQSDHAPDLRPHHDPGDGTARSGKASSLDE